MEILEQMRQAREELGLDLHALEHRTRVRLHLLEAVEQGRFEDLPRGVYARAVVRAYATAVGMDPNRVVTAVAALLPEAEDVLDGIARVRGLPRLAAGESHLKAAGAAAPAAAAAMTTASALARANASDPIATAAQTTRDVVSALRELGMTGAPLAAAIDGALLLVIHLAVTTLGARAAGVTVSAFAELAAPALLMLFVLIGGLYFLLLGGVRGATIGARLAGMRLPDAPARHAGAIGSRALDVAARELSIVVDLFLPLVQRPAGISGAGRSERRAEDPVAVR